MAINTDFSITGDATATLGYDLDLQKFGFKNVMNSNIRLDLVPKQSSKKPGEDDEMPGGWHAVIELKDFRIIIDDKYDDDDADKAIEAGAKTQPTASGASAGQTNVGAGPGQLAGGHETVEGTMVREYPHTHTPDAGTDTESDTTDASLGILTARVLTPEEIAASGMTFKYPAGYQVSAHTHTAPAENTVSDKNHVLYSDAKWSLSNESYKADKSQTLATGLAGALPASGAVDHVHQVTAKNTDADNYRDVYTIDSDFIKGPVATPEPHTHDEHTHEGHVAHTHSGHSHHADVHGEHFHFGNVVVTNPTVAAKLVNGPLSIKIYSEPGNAAGLIDAVEDDDGADDYRAEGNDKPNDVHVDLGGQGISLGYKADDFGVTVGISSDVDWAGKDDKGNAGKGGWVISGDLKVDIGPAKVDLQIVQGIQTKDGDETVGRNKTGFGAKIGGELGSLNLSAGADVVLTGEGDVPPAGADTTKTIRTRTTMAGGTYTDMPQTTETTAGTAKAVDDAVEWEFGAGLGFELSDTTKLDAKYIYSTVESVASDIEVSLSDDKGIIENLSFAFTWGLYDIANGAADGPATENDQIDMLVKGEVGYGFDALGGKLTPSVKVTYNQVDNTDPQVVTEVSFVLTEAIPLAELGLKWKSTSLFEPDDNDQGVLTAWTKVTY
jgi:hypothetical protein